jgi:hypothetical protein
MLVPSIDAARCCGNESIVYELSAAALALGST